MISLLVKALLLPRLWAVGGDDAACLCLESISDWMAGAVSEDGTLIEGKLVAAMLADCSLSGDRFAVVGEDCSLLEGVNVGGVW